MRCLFPCWRDSGFHIIARRVASPVTLFSSCSVFHVQTCPVLSLATLLAVPSRPIPYFHVPSCPVLSSATLLAVPSHTVFSCPTMSRTVPGYSVGCPVPSRPISYFHVPSCPILFLATMLPVPSRPVWSISLVPICAVPYRIVLSRTVLSHPVLYPSPLCPVPFFPVLSHVHSFFVLLPLLFFFF